MGGSNMLDKIDYKKEYKDLYQPKQKPMTIEVPAMQFIMVDGVGNPNDQAGEYKAAVEALYGLSYTIKMSKTGIHKPEGYFEYVVPPLEGLWWLQDEKEFNFEKLKQKSKYCWTSMIRQPEFVTQEVFEWAIQEFARKKPNIDTSKARLETLQEGLCVQMLHIGPFDQEPKTIEIMERYIEENGLESAVSDVLDNGKLRRHHEIYMGDPRKIEPDKMKTVLRHPVKNK